ncbi:MAG: XRE family transcriptional regulator [Alphaproteobacteria bacterium]|nr:XRE family transcriptional regulator [Alphaproteobacteria bacterium]MCY4320485.1 XRE family transcriptional regulator [Alphaproteobacteria bacterium]
MHARDLGLRLRKAREFRGLSQQAAAQALNIPRTAITQLEAGSRSVSTLELTRLSELYLRSVADLLHEDPTDEDQDVLVTLHRMVPGLEEDPAAHQQVTRCVHLCREGVALVRLLGTEHRSGPPSYDMPLPRSPGEAVAQGEETAEQERRRLGIANAPISDVSELITSQGIWASGVTLPDGMSGLFLRHPSIGLAILVNSSHPKGRKRFSYAHEYAHALLDRNGHVTISSTDNSSEMVEKRANAFAAAFLMPRDGVRASLRALDKGLPSRQDHAIFDAASGGHIEAAQRPPTRSQHIIYKDNALLAHNFGVSYQAAAYRLKSLRYISARECSDLLDRGSVGREYLVALSKFDDVGKRERRQYWDRELRSEIVHLAIEAYRLEEISRGRILELGKNLRIKGDTLLNLAEAARSG